MDEALQSVLAEYERRAVVERQLLETLPPAEIASRIDEFLIPIGPDTGKLLHLVITAARARVLVELGASYGYSTLWLADAARVTGGRVHSFELSAAKVEHARGQLRRAGLDAYVEFTWATRSKPCAACPARSTSCWSTCGKTSTFPASISSTPSFPPTRSWPRTT
jgi:predicted O-methyltransferase YrrM